MKTSQALRELSERDTRKPPKWEPLIFNRDPQHLEIGMQNRAITPQMIDIALMYGVKSHIRGATSRTITDRSLRNTPYEKFTDELRGLRLICHEGGDVVRISTAYWADDVKK